MVMLFQLPAFRRLRQALRIPLLQICLQSGYLFIDIGNVLFDNICELLVRNDWERFI